MNFKDYQTNATKTAIYPNIGNNYVYPLLGLSGETGEVAEKFKKLIRDKNGIIDDKFLEDITKELGDILWYLAALSSELNLSLDIIAEKNLEKLANRQQNNTLHGSGDNR